MSTQTQIQTAASIPPEQKRQMDQLRREFKNQLPSDLDTELNLYRWIHGWNGNIREASQRLRTYIENRRAARLDREEFPDEFLTNPILHKYGLYFSFSITSDNVNPYDNTVVVVQKMEGTDFHRMTKVLTCGNFIELYFVACERVFREILKIEKETGKKCGLTIIYDLANFPILNYVNPNAPIHKIHKLCLHVLQDYYCDMLHKICIVNAPTMLGIVLEIVKKFLNPMTQEKLVIVPDSQTLLKHIHPSSVPIYYGGNFKMSPDRVESLAKFGLNMNPDTNSLFPKQVTDADHVVPRQFPCQTVVEYLKPKQKFEFELKTSGKKNAELHWQFNVNAEVQFGVLKVGENGQRTLVSPRFVLNTPKLPEQGSITCDSTPATYILEFHNCGTSWFSLKLEYAAYVEEAI